jgi:GT2 family glycosyltransferase
MFGSLKKIGIRATGGELISLAAFVRRNDPVLYSDWIKRGEPSRAVLSFKSGLECSSEVAVSRNTDILMFLPRIESHLVFMLAHSLKGDPSINCIFLISADSENLKSTFKNQGFDFSIECVAPSEISDNKKLMISRSVTSRNFILMHTPGLLRAEFLRVCQQRHANNIDAVFCDHDELVDNHRSKPRFKPGYSKELLWDPSYIPTASISCSIFDAVVNATDFDDELDPSKKGYELIVKSFQASTRVIHEPKVLFHLQLPVCVWREFIDVYDATKTKPFIDLTHAGSSFPEHYVVPENPFKISFVIPTRDRFDLLAKCVDSILKNLPEGGSEILILDNQSLEAATLDGLALYSQLDRIKVLSCDYEFNWARLTNDGIKASSGEVIVLLNNDTMVLTPDWCDRLANLVLEDGVGTAGALLLYPSGDIQHAGVVAGFGGYADHIYISEAMDNRPDEIFVSPLVRRDVLACTGACLAFSRETYERVGEFDESLVVVGDVDFCLRSYQLGLRNIMDPSVRLSHEESQTREKGLPAGDREILKFRLNEYLKSGDPYFNANLSLSSRSPMPVL